MNNTAKRALATALTTACILGLTVTTAAAAPTNPDARIAAPSDGVVERVVDGLLGTHNNNGVLSNGPSRVSNGLLGGLLGGGGSGSLGIL
ncbi:hypothetical protein [Streptomyces sp. A1136]|uniref:hypothetical protein n=1 Tax=Streptomyces sp. A1136 TaxID=2563102 RepID=UPI00109E865C|nr:hypothetical protein [Streptomyces sp. A1136]THA46064.1 hypothetical protein E6R62_34920 [Streptomyces sp. A1136]